MRVWETIRVDRYPLQWWNDMHCAIAGMLLTSTSTSTLTSFTLTSTSQLQHWLHSTAWVWDMRANLQWWDKRRQEWTSNCCTEQESRYSSDRELPLTRGIVQYIPRTPWSKLPGRRRGQAMCASPKCVFLVAAFWRRFRRHSRSHSFTTVADCSTHGAMHEAMFLYLFTQQKQTKIVLKFQSWLILPMNYICWCGVCSGVWRDRWMKEWKKVLRCSEVDDQIVFGFVDASCHHFYIKYKNKIKS